MKEMATIIKILPLLILTNNTSSFQTTASLLVKKQIYLAKFHNI